MRFALLTAVVIALFIVSVPHALVFVAGAVVGGRMLYGR